MFYHGSCRQLILLLELYSPRDVYDYLRPIALNLCADKVSSVRWISYKLVRVTLAAVLGQQTGAGALESGLI